MVVPAQVALANNQNLEKQPELMQFFLEWCEESRAHRITEHHCVLHLQADCSQLLYFGITSARDFTND